MPELAWLPKLEGWQQRLGQVPVEATLSCWQEFSALANARLNFPETLQLDRALRKRFDPAPPPGLHTRPVRLAILGSSTVEHLLPGIRVAALRRNIWVTTYVAPYGQFLQEILDESSGLHRFKPDVVLFALDAMYLFGHGTAPLAGPDEIAARVKMIWSRAKTAFACRIIQQTVLPLTPPSLGHNEHRAASSPRRQAAQLNERLREWADVAGVDLLALDDHVTHDGLRAWHDPALWHKAKQEVSPQAAPYYGDLVARVLAAAQGLSGKCLVLDLDNSLWGGVIGDDGLEGIKLGQGSALGETFLAIQRYAHTLAQRGIILAVCSKNDEANALLPFDKHPEMILKRGDIACFVANWNDKATNLREIARRLNIGLDALVFLDDNPFERNIVRRELPMVMVPEMPDDPARYPEYLAASGYFEALHVTSDDLERSQQYQANLQREQLQASTTDLAGYLQSLAMELQWAPFDRLNLPRIVQLINKSNQFNLTTRRYSEPEVLKVMENPRAFTLHLRLLDRFGDNGIIAVVIGEITEPGRAAIDTWLMSCRVLGRGVEEATLSLVAEEARRLGAMELIGDYCPTAKNGIVQEHYAKLGFEKIADLADGATRWRRTLKNFTPGNAPMTITRV